MKGNSGREMPYPCIESIVGRQLAGGHYSARIFSKLLGLDNPERLFKIKAVAWNNDHVEVSIEGDKKNEIIFLFEKLQPGPVTFLNTKYLTLRCRSRELTSSLSDIVFNKFSGKWYNLTLEKLAELMLGDPDFGKPGLPMPAHADTFRKSRSLLDTWGNESAYADFFARGELERAQLDSIEIFNNCINIQHSDLECSNVSISEKWPTMQLVNFPWESRVRKIGVIETEKDVQEKQANVNDAADGDTDIWGLMTDLTENDVIMGSNDKVKKVLDYALSHNSSKMLFFSNTCVPTVTGEDVESVVKHYQKKSAAPLMYLTVTAQSMTNVLKGLLVERRLKAENTAAAPADLKINLVGFQKDSSLNELMDFLSDSDVGVNTVLLPALDFKDIDRFVDASLNVFLPNNLWQHLYAQLLLNSKIPYISPVPPYGMKGTKKWLETIVSHLGITGNVEGVWDARFAQIKEQWSDLVCSAEKYRLCFVLRDDEIHYLMDPANTWGVPLVGVLEEMGFSLDICIKTDSGNPAGEIFSHVKSLFLYPDRHRFLPFHDFDSMRIALRESESSAVFSNHAFDWRITEAGKNQFSLQHFEKGMEGAVNTLKRLLTVCNMSFYRKYHRYLKRTPVGLFSGEQGG